MAAYAASRRSSPARVAHGSGKTHRNGTSARAEHGLARAHVEARVRARRAPAGAVTRCPSTRQAPRGGHSSSRHARNALGDRWVRASRCSGTRRARRPGLVLEGSRIATLVVGHDDVSSRPRGKTVAVPPIAGGVRQVWADVDRDGMRGAVGATPADSTYPSRAKWRPCGQTMATHQLGIDLETRTAGIMTSPQLARRLMTRLCQIIARPRRAVSCHAEQCELRHVAVRHVARTGCSCSAAASPRGPAWCASRKRFLGGRHRACWPCVTATTNSTARPLG